MPLDRDDLIFSAGTHVATPFLDRIEPAAAAGYAALSAYPYEIDALLANGMTAAEIRSRVADAGLAVGELDAVTTWLPNSTPPPEFPPEFASVLLANTPERLCAMGESIGARSVTVVEYYGAHPDVDTAAEAFAYVSDVAAEHGMIAHLEFLPWTGINDLVTATEIVRRAGRANGGLLVDSWHFFRSGSTFEQLAAVPGDRVLYVQLDDAPATAEADLSEETQHRRLLPGEGELDLAEFVRALDRIGANAPIGVEVFSDELVTQPVFDVARRSAAAARDVIGAARAR
jgi:sugar phosphate isomerase/epimerase